MSRQEVLRNNWFDGQEINEIDMDVEQSAWRDSLLYTTNLVAGSGIEQEFATQRVLFDTDDVPDLIQDIIDSGEFDGEPIYEEDTLGNTTFYQPSDRNEGVQLEVNISGADISASFPAKIYLFGIAFGGQFTQEVLVFEQNESQVTRQYFITLIAIMTQDFLGNKNTIVVSGVPCRNTGGRLKILEATPMDLVRDPIMIEQSKEPNQNYIHFKPAVMTETLDDLLNEIAESYDQSEDDLGIEITATDTRELPNNVDGLIVGQKFKAYANNIQKVSLLLSVQENTLAVSGHEFDWSGDLVVGIRKLQKTSYTASSTSMTAIEYDPEPSVLAEMSFSQDDLADIGVVLDDDYTVVDFVFTSSLIANPAIEPDITVGDYYVVTIERSGDVSTGTIVLPVAANTNDNLVKSDETYMTVFSQNQWVDIPENDMWFKIYSSSVRITNGTAFDNGTPITSPKTKENASTGFDEAYIDGHYDLVDVGRTADNYVIVQKSNNFSDEIPHPSTGNLVFTRISDVPDVSVVSEDTLTTLIEAGNKPVVLGAITDSNPRGNEQIAGYVGHPGLVKATTFTLIAPSSDLWVNNVVGSVLTPNTSKPTLKYKIIKQDVYDDAYGDVNNDSEIDSLDVARAQVLDGYSKSLEGGTIASADQKNAIVYGTVTMEEILRADVAGSDVINVTDASLIQQHIDFGTAFTAGSTFKRVVLTVEDLLNPTTVSADMITADSSFNDVPFSPIAYQISSVTVWKPENITFTDLRRFVSKTFTAIDSEDITGTVKSGGTNDSFIPGNVLLGGSLLELDGTSYPIDLEVCNIVLDLPEGSTQGELDIFTNFIKDQMKFGDGTLVGISALSGNQVKVTAAIQSFVKDEAAADGYDYESVDGYYQVKETIAVLYTQSSGLLRIRANNIRNLSTRPELRTKIILTVYLKKAGFANTDQSVTDTRVTALLTAI